MIRKWLFFFLLPYSLFSAPPTDHHLTTIYNSLDRQSIAKLFAFYHLYPQSEQGKQALTDAWTLLQRHRPDKTSCKKDLALPAMEIDSIIALVNKQPFEAEIPLTQEELTLIEALSDHLSNRPLKGFSVWDKEGVIALPSHEVDLSRALLIYQFDDDTLKIRQYEATLDLIALQILAKLNPGASHEEKIEAINHFIFHEKRFRFPPHSLWAKDIDVYTFLPSVLDSRLGVCLGVSILYLSIAQRLDLPLEIVTPPGHIFIRYNNEEKSLNIETTARGIHLPNHVYLGINTRKLQTRTLKEVVGLAFINQASVAWQKGDHKATVDLYEKALPYMPNDPLLKMFLGYNYLFTGKIEEGTRLLKEIKHLTFDHAVAGETTPSDFLEGRVGVEGIKAIFSHVDETRQSILDKQNQLKQELTTYPQFRDGILQLAITYLQLGRAQEAYQTLSEYHTIDPTNPTVEYYLSIVCQSRFYYEKAWTHLKNAQKLTKERGHSPHCLKGLNHSLKGLYPDPEDILPSSLPITPPKCH